MGSDGFIGSVLILHVPLPSRSAPCKSISEVIQEKQIFNFSRHCTIFGFLSEQLSWGASDRCNSVLDLITFRLRGELSMGAIGCSRYSISRGCKVSSISRLPRFPPGREAWCLVRAHPRQIGIHLRHSPRFQDRLTTERKDTQKRNQLKIGISENPGFGIRSPRVRGNASRAKPGFSGLGEIWGDSMPQWANRLSLIYGAKNS